MRAQRAQRARDPLQSLQRRGQELKQQVRPAVPRDGSWGGRAVAGRKLGVRILGAGLTHDLPHCNASIPASLTKPGF